MLQLGEIQTLEAIKKVDFGMYFADPEGFDVNEKVLVPKKQLDDECELGDELDLFLYKDSSDRLIATTRMPYIVLGQVKRLEVAQVTKIGAFLNWGLEKELLLPFKEQTYRVKEGETCLAALYIDKSNRLCATMKLYHYLEVADKRYKKDDMIKCVVYEESDNFGAFVAIDDQYSGLIPKKELYGAYTMGEVIDARVIEVRDDGKVTLSLRQKAYMQIATDSDKIMKLIVSYDGVLPFNDKASPETIRRETGMSKNEFKRAVGNLLKLDKIEITDKSIRLK